ncbi:MAG TPA: amidase, partial [Anaerolineae bacterium]|nr:amidase [Anaerolineae bacterium]
RRNTRSFPRRKCDAVLDQIDWIEEHFTEREPEVLAFLPEADRFSRVRREARQLLKQYPQPDRRPPLFGVLIGVKDIFRVDGFPTRAGSRLPPELFAGEEAESVTRLRAAGALVLGKTVSTEFAYFAPGPTRNPHNLQHTPGGSSSGSAAAVAAGLCPLALGSQTIGSIIRPAAFCGVIGYKPSYDRISRAGVIPMSPSLDHVGLFALKVADMASAAKILIDHWESEILNRQPILGIPAGPYLHHASEEGLQYFRSACDHLQAAGYEIKPAQSMPDFEAICTRHNLIVAAEAARVHIDWFAHYGDLYHPQTAELIRRGQQISDKTLADALSGRAQLRDELGELMAVNHIDLWISPATIGPAPLGLDSTGDPIMNLPWTHSGLPALSLPCGTNEAGLPLGLQVVGGWYSDEQLLNWVEQLERVVKNHVDQ